MKRLYDLVLDSYMRDDKHHKNDMMHMSEEGLILRGKLQVTILRSLPREGFSTEALTSGRSA